MGRCHVANSMINGVRVIRRDEVPQWMTEKRTAKIKRGGAEGLTSPLRWNSVASAGQRIYGDATGRTRVGWWGPRHGDSVHTAVGQFSRLNHFQWWVCSPHITMSWGWMLAKWRDCPPLDVNTQNESRRGIVPRSTTQVQHGIGSGHGSSMIN